MQRWHTLVVERDLATDQHVQHNSKTPYIHLRPGVNLRIEKLRSGEVERTTECRKMMGWVIEIGQAEVDDLNVACLRNENVLNLEICGLLRQLKSHAVDQTPYPDEPRYSCGNSREHSQSAARTCEPRVPAVDHD